jgi:hypothetical protein
MWATSVIFMKLPNANNHPLGENSPNLVTLNMICGTYKYVFMLDFFQDSLEYRKKMRLLKVRMLDGTVKSLMVDDSQTVNNLMVIICTKIGITNHDEYSLVWEKAEEEQENIPTNR